MFPTLKLLERAAFIETDVAYGSNYAYGLLNEDDSSLMI